MNKMKQMFSALTVILFSVYASIANADLPAGATDAFTTVKTDGLALVEAAYPTMIALVVALVVFKLVVKYVKRVGGAA